MVNKKDKVQINGITRNLGLLAIEFVDFLDHFENLPEVFLDGNKQFHNIFIYCAYWCKHNKYNIQKTGEMNNLVNVYVHKILRHQHHSKEE